MEKTVEDFHEEVKVDLNQIKDKIEEVRGKVISKIK